MRTRFWACLAVAALCLTGCKGFWDAIATTPSGGSTTLTSGYIYVLNSATNELVGLYVSAGTMTAISNSTFSLGATPLAITVAPSDAFLYVSTLGGIFVYSVNTSTGQLTIANSGQPISSDPATSMQVDATNSWLVEGFPTTSSSTSLFAVHLNPSTGLPASTIEEAVALPAASVQQVAVSPDNTFVLVAMGSGGTATIPFAAGNANPFGKVGTISTVNTSGAALSVAFDPIISPATSPRLFYIGETVATASTSNTGGLRAFNFSTVKEISGSPFAISGLAPYSILPFSNGEFVYVVSRQTSSSSTGVIAGFSVAGSSTVTPSLTALGSTFTAGTNPQALVEDSTGAFVFCVNYGGSPDLLGYVIDSTNAGYLDEVTSNATGTDPVEASAIAALH